MREERLVLIVDDDSALVEVLELSFSVLENIKVAKAFTGEQGIEKAKELMPDLIIMDYKMPGMNGWDATKIIKDNPATAAIPVVGYTAWASMEDVKKGLNCGLSEIITKPIDLDDWEEKLTKYL